VDAALPPLSKMGVGGPAGYLHRRLAGRDVAKAARLNDAAGKRFAAAIGTLNRQLELRGDDSGGRLRLAATGGSQTGGSETGGSQISQVNGRPTSRR
jgi:hypothetical protein